MLMAIPAGAVTNDWEKVITDFRGDVREDFIFLYGSNDASRVTVLLRRTLEAGSATFDAVAVPEFKSKVTVDKSFKLFQRGAVGVEVIGETAGQVVTNTSATFPWKAFLWGDTPKEQMLALTDCEKLSLDLHVDGKLTTYHLELPSAFRQFHDLCVASRERKKKK